METPDICPFFLSIALIFSSPHNAQFYLQFYLLDTWCCFCLQTYHDLVTEPWRSLFSYFYFSLYYRYSAGSSVVPCLPACYLFWKPATYYFFLFMLLSCKLVFDHPNPSKVSLCIGVFLFVIKNLNLYYDDIFFTHLCRVKGLLGCVRACS